MGQLRSARDIAAERTAEVKPLTIEERRLIQQEEFRLAGRALADRYLSAGDIRMLEIPNRRDDGIGAPVIRRAAAERLLEGLAGVTSGNLDRIENGLKALSGDSFPRFSSVLKDFLAAVKKLDNDAAAEAEALCKREMAEMGIAGSAVAGVNPRAWPYWDGIIREKEPELRERLDELARAASGREA